MKNLFLIKLQILVIVAILILSVTGCKGGEVAEAPSSSSEVSSVDENPSSDEEHTEESEEALPYEENNGGEDYWEDGDYSEDEYLYFEENIRVNNASEPVENDFLGLNNVYHCFTYINDEFGRNYTEAQAQLEFNRLQNMGVKIVRTYYNEEYAFDAEKGEFNWESDDMKAVYKWMLEMQKRGISVACNTGWAIDGCYNKNYWVPWSASFVDGDVDATIKNHAKWMSESLNQFRAHGINNVDYLVMFTEPGANDEKMGKENVEKLKETKIEDSYNLEPHVDLWLKATRAIHNELVKNGTRSLYKTVGPNCSRVRESADPNTRMEPLYYFAIKKAYDYIDIYSSHSYPLISSVAVDTVKDVVDNKYMLQERIDMAHNIGKKFWYDETNLHGEGTGGNNVFNYSDEDIPFEGLHAGSYFADTMNRGVQNVLWWYLFDQQWPNNTTTNTDGFENGLHAYGYVPSLMHSTIPQSAYYGVSLLTKYFGNNAKVYKTECEYEYFNAGTQQDKNGNWSICISNIENDEGHISIEFAKNIGKQKFYRHIYKAGAVVPTAKAEILPYDKILSTSGDRMVDIIPSNSIVVYTTVKD